ncbi:MAG TPA: XDD3 family exosortase-dependent surface protein [Trichocoleus sp.]|jgi:hypothetical protein
MKFSTLTILLGIAAPLCILATTGQTAQAGTLRNNWNYSIDSFKDGTEGSTIGDKSKFEFYGMAFREMNDRVYFALNSNLSTSGYTSGGARNGKISYGDLLLNFRGSNFSQANGNLLGIRFDASNDTQLKLGLYGNVQATSLTSVNAGYAHMSDHTKYVNASGSASYGDLAETVSTTGTSYFNSQQAAPTNINSGTFLGNISSLMSKTDLNSLGLDFSQFGAKGEYTFGFSVDKALLPNGDFVASLFAECGNDGVALVGETKSVPEPSSLAGLMAVLGLVGGSRQLRRRSQASVV